MRHLRSDFLRLRGRDAVKELTVFSGHARTVSRDACDGEYGQIGNEEANGKYIADKEENEVASLRGLMQTVEEEDLDADVSQDDSHLALISKTPATTIKMLYRTMTSIAIILELSPSLPLAIRLISQPFSPRTVIDINSWTRRT